MVRRILYTILIALVVVVAILFLNTLYGLSEIKIPTWIQVGELKIGFVQESQQVAEDQPFEGDAHTAMSLLEKAEQQQQRRLEDLAEAEVVATRASTVLENARVAATEAANDVTLAQQRAKAEVLSLGTPTAVPPTTTPEPTATATAEPPTPTSEPTATPGS